MEPSSPISDITVPMKTPKLTDQFLAAGDNPITMKHSPPEMKNNDTVTRRAPTTTAKSRERFRESPDDCVTGVWYGLFTIWPSLVAQREDPEVPHEGASYGVWGPASLTASESTSGQLPVLVIVRRHSSSPNPASGPSENRIALMWSLHW
jgi:hypothetical protein